MNNGRHRTTALYRFPRSIGPRYNGAAVYSIIFRKEEEGVIRAGAIYRINTVSPVYLMINVNYVQPVLLNENV